jgi:hypothetical protein
MKRGSSARQPETFVRHGGGYQFRFDIEQVQREVDGEITTEWQYEYVNVPAIFGEPAAVYTQALKQRLIDGIQGHLDATAQTRGYDHILSLCSYATSLDPVFAAEGQAGVEWRDAVWRHGYQVLADVEGGTRGIPLMGELIAELPEIGW